MTKYFLILVFLLTSLSVAQSNDEFQILNRLVEKSLMPVQDFFISDTIKNLRVNFISSGEKNLVDLIRIKILKNIEEDTNSIYSLDILVNKSEIVFPRVVSYPLFGEEKIERVTSLEVSYLFSKSGLKIRNFDFVETVTDTIKLSQVSDFFSKTTSKMPEVPVYRRLIEPALISVATGIIVYLFFITRSK
jgi:hypothetical protein